MGLLDSMCFSAAPVSSAAGDARSSPLDGNVAAAEPLPARGGEDQKLDDAKNFESCLNGLVASFSFAMPASAADCPVPLERPMSVDSKSADESDVIASIAGPMANTKPPLAVLDTNSVFGVSTASNDTSQITQLQNAAETKVAQLRSALLTRSDAASAVSTELSVAAPPDSRGPRTEYSGDSFQFPGVADSAANLGEAPSNLEVHGDSGITNLSALGAVPANIIGYATHEVQFGASATPDGEFGAATQRRDLENGFRMPSNQMRQPLRDSNFTANLPLDEVNNHAAALASEPAAPLANSAPESSGAADALVSDRQRDALAFDVGENATTDGDAAMSRVAGARLGVEAADAPGRRALHLVTDGAAPGNSEFQRDSTTGDNAGRAQSQDVELGSQVGRIESSIPQQVSLDAASHAQPHRATPADAPMGATPAGQVYGEIVSRVELAQRDGRMEFRVRLEPPGLGTVHVHLSASEHSVTARLVVSDEAARQAIESHMHSLRDSLAGVGVSLERFDVARDGGSSQQAWNWQRPEPLAASVAPALRARGLVTRSTAFAVQPAQGRIDVVV